MVHSIGYHFYYHLLLSYHFTFLSSFLPSEAWCHLSLQSLSMSHQISLTFSNAMNSTTTSLQVTTPCKYVDARTVNIRPLTALGAISSLTLCIYFVRQICYFIKALNHFTPFSNNLSIPFLLLLSSELSNRFLSYLKYRSNFSHWPTWSSMIWSLPNSDFISLCSLPCFHTLDSLVVFLIHQDKKFTPISESFVIFFIKLGNLLARFLTGLLLWFKSQLKSCLIRIL